MSTIGAGAHGHPLKLPIRKTRKVPLQSFSGASRKVRRTEDFGGRTRRLRAAIRKGGKNPSSPGRRRKKDYFCLDGEVPKFSEKGGKRADGPPPRFPREGARFAKERREMNEKELTPSSQERNSILQSKKGGGGGITSGHYPAKKRKPCSGTRAKS